MYRIKSIEPHGGQYIVKVLGEGDEAGLTERYLVAKEFLPRTLCEGDLLDDGALESLSSASDLTHAVSKALDVLSYSNVSRRATIRARLGRFASSAGFSRSRTFRSASRRVRSWSPIRRSPASSARSTRTRSPTRSFFTSVCNADERGAFVHSRLSTLFSLESPTCRL